MKKKMITLAAIFAGLCLVTSAAYAFNCKIKSVNGGELVIDCKSKDAKKLSAGQKVKVKPKIEGC